jgi:peptide deformylase
MREIVIYPDPVLRKKCRELNQGHYFNGEPIDTNLKFGWVEGILKPLNVMEVVADMKRLLYSTKHGVGLAAPQIGVDLRIFMLSLDRTVDPIVVINPVISDPQGESVEMEGCLSIPGANGAVKRPASVVVSGQYVNGDKFSFRAEGMIARVCQHEADHLDGKLFHERMNGAARKKVEAVLENLEREHKLWSQRQAARKK